MSSKNETVLMKEIMLAVSSAGHKIFRINVWRGRTEKGVWFDSGVPTGYADLSGCRGDNGKAIYIEVKVKPNRPTVEQARFLLAMLRSGAHAGVAFSVEDALAIVDMLPGMYTRTENYLFSVLERGAANGQRQKTNT